MAAEYRETNKRTPAIFDTHTHVSTHAFDKDRCQVLERAWSSGVAFLEVGFDEESSRKSLSFAEEISGFCAVGIHPHDAAKAENLETRWKHIESLVTGSSRVKAIGEIGLDYFRNLSPREAQIEAFVMGLDVARRHGLPAIIHQRDSSNDIISVIEKHSGGIPLVFHCFSEGIDYARSCLDFGGYISFGGPLTYPRNGHLRDTVRFVPADRLLVETDCPYLPPQSMRGKRNEPSYIVETISAIAGILGETPSEISRLTLDNALRLFAIGEQKW